MSGNDWFEHGRQHAFQDAYGDNPWDGNPISAHPDEKAAGEAGSAQLEAWRAGYKYGEKETLGPEDAEHQREGQP